MIEVVVDRLSDERETILLHHVESHRYDHLGSVGYLRMASGRRVRLYKNDYWQAARQIAALYQGKGEG